MLINYVFIFLNENQLGGWIIYYFFEPLGPVSELVVAPTGANAIKKN
jgi:hypothetical protein